MSSLTYGADMSATKCKLFYDDQSDDIDFSGPAWDLPLTNLQDPRLSKVARSVDAANANTKFYFEFSAAITTDAIILVATNLDEDAQYRITAYSDPGFMTDIFTTGLQDVWPSTNPISDPDEKGIDVIGLLGESVTARYWQMELLNDTNADGFVELGRMHVGTELNQTYNMRIGSTFARDFNTKITRAVAGTPYFNRHNNIRTWTLGFPPEDYDIGWDEFDRMIELSGADRFIYVLAFPDDMERAQQHSFLATIGKSDPFAFSGVSMINTGFTLVEYVG